jgi:uncharacterized protein with PQ loop repeat
MEYSNLRNIFGIVILITGIFNAIKYWIQANKIKKEKTSRGVSRKFTNFSLMNNISRIIYSVIIKDIYIFIITTLAFICICKLYWVQYSYYPYRKRGLKNFRKPNIVLYIINSMLPNQIRRRL